MFILFVYQKTVVRRYIKFKKREYKEVLCLRIYIYGTFNYIFVTSVFQKIRECIS
jgi:hypothetical protein